MAVKSAGFWKYITATAISFVLLFAMMLYFGSTISNQAIRSQEAPACYRSSVGK